MIRNLRFVFFSLPLMGYGALAHSQTSMSSTTIQFDASSAGTPLVHYWSKVVGAGRANEGLRASWQEQLALVHNQAGFQYVRMHGIFHDDMFVYREDKNGAPVYNFQYVDDLYDRILEKGIKPFVELGFSPKQLATVPSTIFWWKANGSPPKDFQKWSELVSAFIRHCIDRYGIEEVRSWYFEVWNEPNLTKPFFRGGSEQKYFDLYRVTVKAVKNVDSQLRVGGPATSNYAYHDGNWSPIWVTDFLDYAYNLHLPVDFVSVHPYPASYPGTDITGHSIYRTKNATIEDLNKIRQVVKNSHYQNAEIDLTEWSSTPKIHDYQHDSLAAADYILRSISGSENLVDALSYWVFTDIFEEFRNRDAAFHGGFGLLTFQGIRKPAFHAYKFLNTLGDLAIKRTNDYIVSKNKKTGSISLIAWNYPADVNTAIPNFQSLDVLKKFETSGSIRLVKLDISNLEPGQTFICELLEYNHGYSLPTWEQMGQPSSPNRKQMIILNNSSDNTLKTTIKADQKGHISWSIALKPWSVISVKQNNI